MSCYIWRYVNWEQPKLYSVVKVMSTSARVVIHLLTLECGSPLDAPPSREEKKLADRIARILRLFEDKQLEEIHDEENLEIDEDEVDGEWNITEEEDDLNLDQPAGSKTITFSGGQEIPEERVWEAAEYHWSTSRKSSRSRKSTQHRFAFLRNERDWVKLKQIYLEGLVKRSGRQKMRQIAEALERKVVEKISHGVSLRDRDLMQFALAINRSMADPLTSFRASPAWLNRSKKHAGLATRRITRFVQKKSFADQGKVEEAADTFVAGIRSEMENYPLDCLVNIDQTALTKETTIPRCLSFKGEKETLRIVQSSKATTHSLTVMPLLFASGTLGETLYVQLQEPNSRFPMRGIFQAKNLFVVAGHSHMMTSSTTLSFFENVFVPRMPEKCLLLFDSWSGFSNHEAITALVPEEKRLVMRKIPPGTTSLIQPADVGFFRYFKSLIKRFHSHVLVHDLPFDIQKRDHILKVVSLVHRNLCHVSFKNLIKFAWYKAGYLNEHPGPFESPIQCLFPRDLGSCQESGCEEPLAFIHCLYCNHSYCFMHYVSAYHWC